MKQQKFINVAVSLIFVITTLLGSGLTGESVKAMPADPTDTTKVPHYFGPWPNWANSPFTLTDANVEIVGDGSGATATASVGVNGEITAIHITNPGTGYTTASVNITGSGSSAAASATVVQTGILTGFTIDAQGSGYTAPTVTLAGGGGSGTLVTVGNGLIDRMYATDATAPPGSLGTVFVILPVTMPASGYVNQIQYWNQASPGISGTPSAGHLLHAYVLRPTANPNEYTVLWDSGELTVPPLLDPTISEPVSVSVPNVAVTTGDVIGFYGQGVPLDLDVGTDVVSYPATLVPALGSIVTLGSAEYPIYPQARSYSFAANVVDTSAVVPLVNATATAYGGVDAVTLVDAGSGYTMPTVDFDLPDDPNGIQTKAHADFDPATGAINAIVVDDPGSGYLTSPKVVIRDGTQFDPINNGGSGATATATLMITSIVPDTFGSGYTTAPAVTIHDPTGSGAAATAIVNAGGVTSITVTSPGSGYITKTGIRKFQDGLPVLCDPRLGWDQCTDNNLGQHIPIAVPDTTTFTASNGFASDADFYVIALVQHREHMSSSLPGGALVREYVQIETQANTGFSKHIALQNDLLDGTSIPALLPDGSQAYAVDDPHYMGPVIMAQRDKPVRLVFYNLLPTGADGDLYIPVDSTMMGSGIGPMDMAAPVDEGSVMDMVRNPMCTEDPKSDMCFKDNRATLHLHGGLSPWISDGSPHQWITPANEMTGWPQGVAVSEVPDMGNVPGVPSCSGANDGCMTFYYTNQQSARLMFYHDHSWGITRLNVYAGEAAGYIINDAVEHKLITDGIIPAEQIPLLIQDRTFVPSDAQLYDTVDPVTGEILSYGQDPTWNKARWGSEGELWYHHVYMPAQNPGDPSGMSAYGRWMYGPWFWPPAKDAVYGPIANPYYDPNCNLDDPTTWQYNTDPFCEPQLIPGTPNISVGMEQFNDTPVVNGTAYPTTTVQPKTYRFRILNAADDRFWNLQWYIADPRTGTDSEVALKADELAAAQTDPVVFPTPDTTISPPGPSWIQIASESGFLPAPVVIPNQHITWITDPTRFDVGNVDQHSLLLGPAERADVIVDFSKFAGKTLILYNDAPAAFPARVPSYDYYTGGPDLSPVGAPTILPGYGPNTRTIMQVKVANTTPAQAFNLTALQNAFKHKADGSGVFEKGQNPIIVGQAGYNSAYGANFAASSWCNAPGATTTRCDGMLRINEQGGDMFGFNTLRSQNTKTLVKIEPKAIHDEMNASSFDDFGRMMGNLGLEAVPATPGLQNVILYPFVNPPTELIDGTNLPSTINVTPIASSTDGTQIWKFTHNGVDTHPIHFHLFDVQVLNRVTWDNIIIPPDPNELGWKDTVRISPLEDTIVAVRPILPVVPFELPNSIRNLNPMMPTGSTAMFNNIDASGNPTTPISNQLVNFGWEYMYHCHILSHEEMDMMRPIAVAVPPSPASGLSYSLSGIGNNTRLILSWNDNSINETSFLIQRITGTGAWTDIGTVQSPLNQPNAHGTRSFTDTSYRRNNSYQYRVIAQNTIGYGGQFMSMTAQAAPSETLIVGNTAASPTNLAASLLAGPQVQLTWRDNATNETGFVIQRADNGGAFAQIATAPARNNTGNVTYTDATVVAGNTYQYRVAAVIGGVQSGFSNTVQISIPVPPAAPANLTAANGPNGFLNRRSVVLNWQDMSNNETGFTIQRATNATFTSGVVNVNVSANTTSYTQSGLARNTNYYFRIRANNGSLVSDWANSTPLPILTNP